MGVPGQQYEYLRHLLLQLRPLPWYDDFAGWPLLSDQNMERMPKRGENKNKMDHGRRDDARRNRRRTTGSKPGVNIHSSRGTE